MAWNIPGGSGGNGRNPRKRGNTNPLDKLLDPLRGLFGGGSGGGGGGGAGIARWAGVLVVLWLLFNCFVLITEQQRGVVLRFGEYARTLPPGLNFKWPWPIERVTKVNATEIKTFSDNVPVLTSDENIVQVEINVQYRIADPEKFLFGTRDGEQVLQQAALSTVREQVGRSPLDTVLGARNALAGNRSMPRLRSPGRWWWATPARSHPRRAPIPPPSPSPDAASGSAARPRAGRDRVPGRVA